MSYRLVPVSVIPTSCAFIDNFFQAVADTADGEEERNLEQYQKQLNELLSG